MKKTAFLLAALGALTCLPAAAQTRAPAPSAVTPSQIEAAEKEFQTRARRAFRSVARVQLARLAAVQVVKPGATAADLGVTVSVTPRTPWVADKAWLGATLGISDPQDDVLAILAYPDEFAPNGAIDIVIKTTPGKRYLVECSALTLGAPDARGTVYAGAASGDITQQIAQASYPTSAPGAVISVATPASTAAYLRVSLDIARASVSREGMATLLTDKCDVTPFS